MKRMLILFGLALCLLYGCSAEPSETSTVESSFQSEGTSESDSSALSNAPDESLSLESSEENDVSHTISSDPEQSEPEQSDPPGAPGEGKYGEFSVISEQGEKRIITLYSAEQITELTERRENGEWFSLSTEEILFLIEDTQRLFLEFDLIRIRDLKGNVHTFRGDKFIFSEEYLASFGGYDLGTTDASFDLRRDFLKTALMRIEVLHSGCFVGKSEFEYLILTGADPLTEKNMEDLRNAHSGVYKRGGNNPIDLQVLSNYQNDLVWIDIRNRFITCIYDISKANQSHRDELFSPTSPLGNAGQCKYDNSDCLIIELWEESNQTQQLIARVRFDPSTHTNIFQDLESKVAQISISSASAEKQVKKYRAVVYGLTLKDFFPQQPFVYFPDGDVNQFSYADGMMEYDFMADWLFMEGVSPVTEYINQLLEKELQLSF